MATDFSKYTKLEADEATDNTDISGTSLSASFYKEDTAIKYKFFYKVKFLKSLSRAGTRPKRQELVGEFHDKLEKSYNDHKRILTNEHTNPSSFFEPIDVGRFVKPKQVAKPKEIVLKKNLIVLSGMTKLAEIMAGQSNTLFTYFEVGESPVPVGPLNTKLGLPVHRVSIEELGWHEPHGNSVRRGTLFPESMRDSLICEIGCMDAPEDPSAMLFRVVIEQTAKYLKHEEGVTYLAVSHVNNFNSV